MWLCIDSVGSSPSVATLSWNTASCVPYIPPVPVKVNDAPVRARCKESFSLVTVKLDILKLSILVLSSVKTWSYVEVLPDVYADIACPATLIL